jgi:hypothetical protein
MIVDGFGSSAATLRMVIVKESPTVQAGRRAFSISSPPLPAQAHHPA